MSGGRAQESPISQSRAVALATSGLSMDITMFWVDNESIYLGSFGGLLGTIR